jgi:hypothetical protein
LIEYDYPAGADVEKGYLLGRFGAIPFIRRATPIPDMLEAHNAQ